MTLPRKDKNLSEKQQEAAERGKSIPFYTKEVVKNLNKPPAKRKLTPSKRG